MAFSNAAKRAGGLQQSAKKCRYLPLLTCGSNVGHLIQVRFDGDRLAFQVAGHLQDSGLAPLPADAVHT